MTKYITAAEMCACSNLRRASRALTQLFEQALQPSGLRSTQFIILLEIAAARSTTQPQLARRLVMDPSTVARNLKLIAKRGWIKSESSPKRRNRVIILTGPGLKVLEEAVPLWEKVQNSFVKQLGEKRWRTLQSHLSTAVAIARGSFRR